MKAKSKKFHRPTINETGFPDGTLVRITEVGESAYLAVSHRHILHMWCVPRSEGWAKYQDLIGQVEHQLKLEGLLQETPY